MSGIIGTGGHIDHGKTALVAALTGVDTDRLPEEKRRGISIDLGFSHLDLGGELHGIVDVPGHEDFIRNMLAGATGFDVLLLVVAADEGVMPQTREHVTIAGLLGVPRAVVALTKADLVSEEWLELARDDVRGFLAKTPFADAPVITASATAGTGLDELRHALEEALPPGRRRADDLFRMPVDRVFTVRGTGTVTTGTVWSGSLAPDAMLRIEPGGTEARVRGLQVHGRDVDEVRAGQRAAVALAGVDRDSVARGTTLVHGAGWRASSILTVRLAVAADSAWSIQQRQRVRVHLGTAEVLARLRLLEAARLEPGGETWAQLRLERPLLARAGDRFVLRSYSPVTTIGGGRVVEPNAPRRKRVGPDLAARLDGLAADPITAVETLIRSAAGAGVPVEWIAVDAGASPRQVDAALTRAIVTGGRAFDPAAAEIVRERLHRAIDAYHRAWPLRQGIEMEELRRAAGDAAPALTEHVLNRDVATGRLEMRAGRVARPGHAATLSGPQGESARGVLDALRAAGAAPPPLEELLHEHGLRDAGEIVRFLEDSGALVRLQPGLYVHASVMDEIAAAVRGRLAGRSGLGPADFRHVIDVSRKHLIPILEQLDLRGVTARDPSGRSVPADASA